MAPAPRSGGVSHRDAGGERCPALNPQAPLITHAHTRTTAFPSGPVQPCPLRVWGHQPGADKAPEGSWPLWSSSGSETAQSCPRDENGKGGHLARPVSCGVSPVQRPGTGPRPLPILTGTKGLGLSWRGHYKVGAQEPGPLFPTASPLRLMGVGVQGGPSSWQLKT